MCQCDFKRILPYLLLFVFVLSLHMLTAATGDDHYFQDMAERFSLREFSEYRYRTWSSRTLIEAALYFCVQNYSLWTVANALVWCLLAYGITRLFGRDCKAAWLVVALCALLPPAKYSSAGWASTEINYIWPISMGVTAFLPATKGFSRKWYAYALCATALIFACSLEQLSPVIFALYLLITIDAIRRKDRIYLFALLQTALALAGICHALACPGNAQRMASSIATWFPDFEELTLLSKLEMGCSSTLYHYMMEPNMLYTALAGMVAVNVCAQRRSTACRIVFCIPLTIGLVFGVFSDSLSGVFPKLVFYKSALSSYGTSPTLEDISSFFPGILVCATFLILLVGVPMAFRDNPKSMAPALIMLLAGLCSRMVMAFSPTIWSSGTRTFLIMDFCIIACAVLLYENLREISAEKERGTLGVIIGCVVAVSTINNFILYK